MQLGNTEPTNELVELYRKRLAESGKTDYRSNAELTLEFGRRFRANGDTETEKKYPEFRKQFLDLIQDNGNGVVGEAWSGVKRGVAGTAATGLTALALGADAVGADGVAASLATKAAELEGGNAPAVSNWDDVHDVSSGAKYLAGKVGEAVPSIAEALVAGGVGAAVGKQAVKAGVKKALGKTISEAAARNAAAMGAGAANSWALSAGEIYGDTKNPGLAAAAGAVAAIPDTFLPTYILSKFYGGKEVGKEAAKKAVSFWKEFAKEVPKTIPLEAGTEVFQQAVNIAARKYNAGEPATFTTDDWKELREAGIGGAAGGFVGAPMAAGGNVTQAREPEPVAPSANEDKVRAARAAQAAAAFTVPKAEPVQPTAASAVVELSKLDEGEAKLRLAALEKLAATGAKLQPSEQAQLDVLRVQFPAQVVTVENADVPGVMTPAKEIGDTPGQGSVEEESAPAAISKPKLISTKNRIRAAAAKVKEIVAQYPVDTSAFANASAVVTREAGSPESLAALENEVAKLESQVAALESQRVRQIEAEREAKLGELMGKGREKAQAERAKQDALAGRAVLKQNRINAALPVATPLPAPVVESAQAPAAPVKLQTDTPQPSTGAASTPVVPAQPLRYGKLKFHISEVGSIADRFKQTPEAFSTYIEREISEYNNKNTRSGLFAGKGNERKTATAIAWSGPDGKVYLTGMLNKEKLARIGKDTGKSEGYSVESMGSRVTGEVVESTDATGVLTKKKIPVKSIVPGGPAPVHVEDMVAAGYVPLEIIAFDKPGNIFEVYPSKEAFDAAFGVTDKSEITSVRARDVLGGENKAPAAVSGAPIDGALNSVPDETAVSPAEQMERAEINGMDPEIHAKFKAALEGPKTKDQIEYLREIGDVIVQGQAAIPGLSKGAIAWLTEIKNKNKLSATDVGAFFDAHKGVGPSFLIPAVPVKKAKEKAAKLKVTGPLSSIIEKRPEYFQKLYARLKKANGELPEVSKLDSKQIEELGIPKYVYVSIVEGAFAVSQGKKQSYDGFIATMQSVAKDALKAQELEPATPMASDARVNFSQPGLKQMATEAETVEILLNRMIDAGVFDNFPERLELAKKLLSYGRTTLLETGGTPETGYPGRPPAGVLLSSISGFYHKGQRKVVLFDGAYKHEGRLTHTILHEYLHAFTMDRSVRHDDYLRELMRRAKAKMNSSQTFYGMSNVDEFIAEALTSRKFQEFLKGVQSFHTADKSIWDDFVAFVSRLIGFKNTTVLSEVMRTVGDIIEHEPERTYILTPTGQRAKTRWENKIRKHEEADLANSLTGNTVVTREPAPASPQLPSNSPVDDTAAARQTYANAIPVEQLGKYQQLQEGAESALRAKGVQFQPGQVRVLPIEWSGSPLRQLGTSLGELERAFGVEFALVQSDVALPFQGLLVPDGARRTILIDASSRAPLMAIAGHEILHAVRRSRDGAAIYRTIKDAVLASNPMPADYAAKRPGYQGDALMEEWVADVVGQRFDEAEFWREMAKESQRRNRGSFAQVAAVVLSWMDGVIRAIRTSLHLDAYAAKDLVRVRQDIARALHDFVETPGSLAEKYAGWTGIDAVPCRDFLNPVNGKIEQPDILPMSVASVNDAAELGHDLEYTAAMDMMKGASWNALKPLLQEMQKETGLDLKALWAIVGKGDNPQAIVDALEARTKGAAAATIEGGTQAMQERSRYMAYKITHALERSAARRAAEADRSATDAANRLIELSKTIAKKERDYHDAATMEKDLKKKLHDLVREAAKDLDRVEDGAERVGELVSTVRAIEKELTGGDLIPAEYQSVFKQIVEKDYSAFDYLSAMASLQVDFGRMTAQEVVDMIKQEGPRNPRLAALAKNRPLMVALVGLARSANMEMDLLGIRHMTDQAQLATLKRELEEIRTASDTRLAEIRNGLRASGKAQGVADRLKAKWIETRAEMRTREKQIKRSTEREELRRKFAAKLAAFKTKLEQDGVGAFSDWMPHEGATYTAMVDGKAVSRVVKMTGEGGFDVMVAEDVARNMDWLRQHEADAGSRLYEEVKRQTFQLALHAFQPQRKAIKRTILDRLLAPFGDDFAATGTAAGAAVKQQALRYQFIAKTHQGLVANGHRWEAAWKDAAKAAGYKSPLAFTADVYDQVMFFLAANPGKDGDIAMREATRLAKACIPSTNVLTEDFEVKMRKFIEETKAASESIVGMMKEVGMGVADPHIKNLLRNHISRGMVTVPRHIRYNVIAMLRANMEVAGWKAEMFSDEAIEQTGIEELVAKAFTPSIVNDFLVPFIQKPGEPVFIGAANSQGKRAVFSQLAAQSAWEDAGGDVLSFIDHCYEMTKSEAEPGAEVQPESLEEYRAAALRKILGLYLMESRLLAENEKAATEDRKGGRMHIMMDGRYNDLIPPEHMQHSMFTPSDLRSMIDTVAYHAAFGRNGEGLKKNIDGAKSELKPLAHQFASLEGATKRQRKEDAKRKGLDYAKLERAVKDLKAIDRWEIQVNNYFAGGNNPEVVGDARTGLEMLRLNMMLVLNQPRSALWNLASIADFSAVYKGSPLAIKGTWLACKTLGKSVYADIVKAVTGKALQESAYYEEVADLTIGRKQLDLPFGQRIADAGHNGNLLDGSYSSQVSRMVRAAQQLSRKPVDGRMEGVAQAVLSPFRYANERIAAAVATANVQVFETIVARGIEALEREGDLGPHFKLSASNLSMKGDAFFVDDAAFDLFRRKAMEYGCGNFEDIVRSAAKRKAEGKLLLTKEQATSIAMMAMNEISLEGSINSRPAEWYNNPVLRFISPLLGWPMMKMYQVTQGVWSSDKSLEEQVKDAAKTIGMIGLISVPVGLAVSFMVDLYDEDILGKKSNMRSASTLGGFAERVQRAGTFGLMGDFILTGATWNDSATAQRSFDLNNRILVFNQAKQMMDAVLNFNSQDYNATYQSVWRPMINTVAGGTVQYAQILNNALGLDNAEAAVTNRINVMNWLRAAGRDAGLEMVKGGGQSSPTPVSVWVREMQVTALANDRVAFLEAYRNAVEAARKDGEEDPEKKVLMSWRARAPYRSVFGRNLTDTEQAKLFGAMDDSGREIVREATHLFDSYSDLIEPSDFEQMMKQRVKGAMAQQKPLTAEQIRRKMAMQGMGF